ncbi:Citrate synthase 1 [Planctomycetes bacterium Pan216]|uniref:Citrate synthase n=1 Tax=Kolteria novifilia TaxID=2527975 RepID=A0A518BBG2_9BACT|nr:Citrate synthase 1 [Planctomycetes bacterium Pan216]
MSNPEKATLTYDGQSMEMPVLTGTEEERGVDITQLRGEMGLVTLDPGYGNTGSTTSKITFIDGEKGILRYRGIPIEELAEKSSFPETAYLLINGHLPTHTELDDFASELSNQAMIHEDMKRIIDACPATVHPMAILGSMCLALSSFYPNSININNKEEIDHTITLILAKMPTIAAFCYKKLLGQPYVYPNSRLSYAENLLQMMLARPSEPFVVDPDAARALDLMLILHADHEQNCSTSTVRLVGSAETNLFATIASGICALWGPLHGGANEAVVKMLQRIHEEGGDVEKYVAKAKDKSSNVRLMGFGHRVYKNFDPRARIIKASCDRVLSKMKKGDALLDIAKRLEEVALADEYFVERRLYPNVDFYSGVIYRALGIPTNMFTVMFAMGRLPGWIAHWKEMLETPGRRIGRPRQIYTGPAKRRYLPVSER